MRNADGGTQPGPSKGPGRVKNIFFPLGIKMSSLAWASGGKGGTLHISSISNQSLNLLKFSACRIDASQIILTKLQSSPDSELKENIKIHL